MEDQINLNEMEYEEKRYNCKNCNGKGEVWESDGMLSKGYEPCYKCNGTGKETMLVPTAKQLQIYKDLQAENQKLREALEEIAVWRPKFKINQDNFCLRDDEQKSWQEIAKQALEGGKRC